MRLALTAAVAAAAGLAMAGCGAASAAPAPTLAPTPTPVVLPTALPTDPPTPTPAPIDPAAYKASAVAMAYPQLDKDPASITGTVVKGRAQVFQYDSNTTTSHFLANVTDGGYGYWSDNVWFDVDPATAAHVCKDTVIQWWGSVVGPYTYSTAAGGSNTVPEIAVQFLNVLSGGC